MTPPHPTIPELADALTDLGRLALQLGRTERAAVYHPDQTTPESSTDHTVMLSWVACAFAAQYFPHLDVGMVAQFAAVHDAVKLYAGDTPTIRITDEQRASKAERQYDAAVRLAEEFHGRSSWFSSVIARYEERLEPEARFVCGLDKILPKITHLLGGCQGLVEGGADRDYLIRAYRRQAADLSAVAGDFGALMELWGELSERVLAHPEFGSSREG